MCKLLLQTAPWCLFCIFAFVTALFCNELLALYASFFCTSSNLQDNNIVFMLLFMVGKKINDVGSLECS
jgi:hypothetical protein